MAIYSVVKYPDPILLQKTDHVDKIGDRERVLIRDMIETMHSQSGVGLAANQIGIARRIFVASPDGERGQELAFFNPEIIKSAGSLKESEGCLSVPNLWEPIRRYKRVTLKATNLKGRAVVIKAEGLLARIFQHEVDHLNGKLFIHRLGLLRRKRCFKLLDHGVKS